LQKPSEGNSTIVATAKTAMSVRCAPRFTRTQVAYVRGATVEAAALDRQRPRIERLMATGGGGGADQRT
jgi:hypothetical protein